ncbi:LptF/LptG family permease [Deinococcus pimensis]|uniref:LptF/LptG family permease n=1 Tax=Deinococcus pimensis TaxID=309888 RepID=UPI00048828CF|nr:LptF/LptG family permease [Deinococcus pimensis]
MPFRLARYVLREVIPLYVAGFVLFLVLSTTDLLSSIVGVLLRNGVPLSQGVELYLARLPYMLNLQILPLAVAFAVLVGFGRLAKDSELKAAQAGGVRPVHLLWPVLLLGLVVSAASFYNSSRLLPAANARFDRLWTEAWFRTPPGPPQQFRYTYRDGSTLYYAGSVTPFPDDPTRATLAGVLVQKPDVTYSAPGGTWDSRKRTWQVTGAYEVRAGGSPRFVPEALTFAQDDRLRQPARSVEQLTLPVLRARASDAGLDVRERREASFTLQRRYAEPMSALALALAAGTLGLLLRNLGWAFASLVLMIFGTYVVYAAMPEMVKAGALSPVLAAWLPNVLLVLVAAVLARRLT